MKEFDIRPRELFNRFLELSQKDIKLFFANPSEFVTVPCPACLCKRFETGLGKLGFQYVICKECHSLYLSPRPTPAMFNAYYRDSDAVKFWGSDFFKKTAETRRKMLFYPRAQLIAKWVNKANFDNQRETFVDVGSGYGLFLEEVFKLGLFKTVLGIEPAPNLAKICRDKGFPVIEKFVENVSDKELQCSFATTFEVLEHVFDPAAFLRSVHHIIRPGGLFLFTTLTVSGFDLQVLWEQSKSICPPHHINFLSYEGMERLVERCGFEILELNTPGTLDLDIIRNAVEENKNLHLPLFVRELLTHRGEETHKAFQEFLQNHNLSSHIRCIAQKK